VDCAHTAGLAAIVPGDGIWIWHFAEEARGPAPAHRAFEVTRLTRRRPLFLCQRMTVLGMAPSNPHPQPGSGAGGLQSGPSLAVEGPSAAGSGGAKR
jgi:hypothetical protein